MTRLKVHRPRRIRGRRLTTFFLSNQLSVQTNKVSEVTIVDTSVRSFCPYALALAVMTHRFSRLAPVGGGRLNPSGKCDRLTHAASEREEP